MNKEMQIPEYVIQPNRISRSIYSCGAFARRLIMMAMAVLPDDPKTDKDYTVEFSVWDFLKAVSEKRSGSETLKYLRAAVEECTANTLKIMRPDADHKDYDNYEIYTWFRKTVLTGIYRGSMRADGEGLSPWATIRMTFNPELGGAIADFKRAYAKISLLDFGKLQSRYAQRFYEMALSYAGFAGKDGNRPGEWYFEKSIEDIRILFDIGTKKYKAAKEFRRNIIDRPIEEINAAGIGIRIEPEYDYQRRRLIGVKFNCKRVKHGEPRRVDPATETEREEETLMTRYPEEYAELYKAELREVKKQPGLFAERPEMQEIAAKGAALGKLRDRHPAGRKKAKKP